jgi:hypothetical protein
MNLGALQRQLQQELTTLPAGPMRAAVAARLRNVERELMEADIHRARIKARDSWYR